MKIKDLCSLEAADLPLVEHPFHASHTVEQLLANPLRRHHLRFSRRTVGCPQGPDSPIQDRQLVRALAAGELFLVYNDTGLSEPFSPLVRWEPSREGESAERWHLREPYRLPAGLKHSVEALNRWQITPQQLRMKGGAGIGNLSASSLTTDLQTHHHREAQARAASTSDLTLPLGASAGVQPLQGAQSSESGPQPETDNSEAPDKLHLVVGIFTDGTLNNVDNIQAFHRKVEQQCVIPARDDPSKIEDCRDYLRLLMGESYASAPTNVVKLFDLYEDGEIVENGERTVTIKVYEPGAGTKTGERDSLEGSATGLGDTGVVAQVDRAFESVIKSIVFEKGLKKIDALTFDLIGFSRGAAAARHALNEILGGPSGPLARRLKLADIPWPQTVSVRFVGLFDTVAGIVNLSDLDFSAGNDENDPVNLYVDASQVGAIVHLTGKDEKRANFSLNSICKVGGDCPENCREVKLPGSHSDIGGGYQPLQEERLLLHPTLTIKDSKTRWPTETWHWDTLTDLRQKVGEEGWIGEHSLELSSGKNASTYIEQRKDVHPPPYGRVDLSLRMRRLVQGEYSEVSRGLMQQLASENGVPFGPLTGEQALQLPPDLEDIYAELSGQVLSGENDPVLKSENASLLKQRYIHYSDHYNLLEFLAWGLVTRLELPFEFLQPFRPAESRERKIYWNTGK